MTAPSTYETSWTIMPSDCNYHYPLVFGGAFFSHLDLCAAEHGRRILLLSPCDQVVTYKFEGCFLEPSHAGDTIILRSKITGLKHNSILIEVNAFKVLKPTLEIVEYKEIPTAKANLIFVSKREERYYPHNLVFNENGEITGKVN